MTLNPRLDFFRDASLNMSNTDFTIASYDPIYAVVPDNPITFVINGDTSFLNLSETLLRFKIKVVQPNGTNLTAHMDNHVALSNLAFSSVFKSIKVKINDCEVTPRTDLYAYKAYIDQIFSTSPTSVYKNSLIGWDTNAGAAENVVNGDNPAFARRAAKCSRSQLQEFVGLPFIDLFKCPKNLLPHIRLEVTLYPNSHAFVIQHDNHANVRNINFQYRLSDVQLFFRKEVVAPHAAIPIEQKLELTPAKYMYPVSAIRQYHIVNGSFTFRADDLFQNMSPVKLIGTFVHTESFAGSYQRDPFWFSPTENIESIEFFKNGTKLGHQRPIEINLAENSSDMFLNYITLQNVTGTSAPNDGLNFSPGSMRLGNFFTAVDCTPDGQDDLSYRYLTSPGNISVYVKFRQALPHGLDFLVYAVFHETLKVHSKSRKVTTSSVI